MSCGVVYVAYGKPARKEARLSIQQFRLFNRMPVIVISNEPLQRSIKHIHYPNRDKGARQAKLNVNKLSPFQYTLYLDADTRPYQSLKLGFDILADGFDLVIAPSTKQNRDFLWHCDELDRKETVDIYWIAPLALQGGVFYFAKNVRTDAFFESWREEWAKYKNQDQGALLRALHNVPLKVWLLGTCWNGGAIVGHRYGQAKRR